MENKTYKRETLVKLASALGSELMPDNVQYTSRMFIASESDASKKYVLSQRKASMKWGCDCMDFTRRRSSASHCKHLRKAAAILNQIEMVEQLAEQRKKTFAEMITDAARQIEVSPQAEENTDEVRTGTCE